METIVIGEKFNSKYYFRETCFGIVVVNNKILLVERDKQFSLVGGGIEKNENFEQCLKREFKEESGYEIKSIKPLVCVDCFWVTRDNDQMESKANIFVVEIEENNKCQPTESGNTIHWIDLNKAIDCLPLPYHKAGLNYFLENYRNKQQ